MRIVAALAMAVAVLVGGTTEAVRAQAPDSTAGAVMQRLSPGAHRLPPLPLGNDRLSVAARAFPVRTVSGSGTSVQGAPPESQTRASDASVPDAPAPGASAPEAGATWTLTVDGQAANWPGGDPPATAPIGDLEHVASQVLERLRARGYYYARIDSATVRRSASPPRVRLHATRGPQVVVGSITLSGTSAVEVASLRREMRTQPGRPLRPDRLKRDLDAMLQTYEDAGYPLAQIRIAETTLRRGSPAQLDLRLHVDEGPALWLKAITLPEEARTSPSLVAHLADLQMGERMTGYNPATIRRRLQRADVFASVGPPELRVDAEGGATLHVPVEETSPGSFDLALGYLPPSPGGGGGQIVGSGRLALRNLFGGARTARLKLDRRPGQTSLFDVSAADPRLFGRPLRLEGRFRGEQRDSTFSQRRYRGTLGYRFGGGWEVLGTVSREVTRPGQEGAQVRGRRQAIPRSEALFYGVGLRFEHVDRPRNPRRGGRLMLRLERGQKERRFFRRTADGDTTRQRVSVAQERIESTVRGYLPLFDRQVLAAGLDASVLLSPSYDRSDLFRVGGAQSLRGYDEDRFLGRAVGRALLEYRLQIDRVSYAYAFGDLGYVERPDLEAADASHDWHPGYGVGIQFGTALGIVNATYALQPADASPASGRVHLRLSFAL